MRDEFIDGVGMGGTIQGIPPAGRGPAGSQGVGWAEVRRAHREWGGGGGLCVGVECGVVGVVMWDVEAAVTATM